MRPLLVFLGVLCILLSSAAGQSLINPYEDRKEPAVKSDIKYIICQVCDNIVKQARKRTKELRTEADASYKKLTEDTIIDHLEKMCNPELKEGGWITRLDMVENGHKIDVVDVDKYGKCTKECRTLGRACEDILEATDLSELSEHLYTGQLKRAGLVQWLCYKQTGVCKKDPPPVPKSRPPGPAHSPITDEEFNTKQMMAAMKENGMRGSMYNTEELLDRFKHMPREPGDGPSDEELLEMADEIERKREERKRSLVGRMEAAVEKTREWVNQASEKTQVWVEQASRKTLHLTKLAAAAARPYLDTVKAMFEGAGQKVGRATQQRGERPSSQQKTEL